MKKKSEIEEWPITTERYVAFIDIMGFKDMVARLKHDEIYDMMKLIHERRNGYEKMAWGLNNNRDLAKTTSYSDSIMVYSKDNSAASLQAFVCVVSALTEDLLENEIPHKGAFAFGTMTLDSDNSIFFGQPLIDAYLLQEELCFYGIIGHATAEKQINLDQENRDTNFLTDYKCPFKNGLVQHIVIYPMALYSIFRDSDQVQKYDVIVRSVKNLRYKTSGFLRRYIENTEQYITAIQNKFGGL